MREYLQKEHMDKKKKPIDLSDWEDYWDPVRLAPSIPYVLLTMGTVNRKDRSNSTAQIAVYSPAKRSSTGLEVSATRETM